MQDIIKQAQYGENKVYIGRPIRMNLEGEDFDAINIAMPILIKKSGCGCCGYDFRFFSGF